MPLELYFHIPFCVKKCSYCDFLSFPLGRDMQRAYVDALCREIRARGEASGKDRRVVSAFFGGGTPSILPGEWLAELLDTAREAFSLEEDAEISLEANPGTLSAGKLKIYREAGFNRLSIGCQSTVEEELRILGRIHSYEEFLESFALAREAGFDNINVDLMSGLPGQKAADWELSLRRIAELGPEHISAYSLILEEGTPLYEMRESCVFPDEEEERLMYEETYRILGEYGYLQYEISNYALPGRECRHNLGYWTGTEYLGMGLGASSYLGKRRFSDTADRQKYLADCGSPEKLEEQEELLSPEDLMGERMILGLRLRSGVSAPRFEEDFGRTLEEQYGSVIEKYRKWNLLEWEGDCLRLTREGISVSNTVMADFL